MNNFWFLLMFPISICSGLLLPYILKTAQFRRPRMVIKRCHCNVHIDKHAYMDHKPDDDTHSIILEAVKKRWSKINVYETTDSPGKIFRYILSGFLIVGSLYGILNSVTNTASNIPEFQFVWAEKLWAAIKPYEFPIYLTIIAIVVLSVTGTWLSKRLRLLKIVMLLLLISIPVAGRLISRFARKPLDSSEKQNTP